jgi:transposase
VKVSLKKLELIDEAAIDGLSREELAALAKLWRQKIDEYQGILFRVKKRLFGPKSERSPRGVAGEPTPATPRKETTKLPSERYPELSIREDKIDFEKPPLCLSCGATMSDSGMTEDSEYLDVEAKEFFVAQQKRHKHRCQSCHSFIATAPLMPRVTPGGSYSDDLIIDATLSKYCDLIPMERYCQMAARGGFKGLPPHSLIRASFRLAEFLGGVYRLIKQETLDTRVLLADETTHRMLEGDLKKRWYLWGFSSGFACFFECHDTRSGDVSSEVLKLSSCQVLISDAYCGYKKSINAANELRAKAGLALIQTAYCNAHARRRFYLEAEETNKDAKFMVDQYDKIYEINSAAKGLEGKDVCKKRAEMKPFFENMRNEATAKIDTYSSTSGMGQAYNYFLKYYDGLTLFLSNSWVPIDNNASERLLRSPVVGRKTWYGTHSKEGAKAAAVHFSIVETCKLNGVNPRQYYSEMVDRIHQKQELLTPRQYKNADNSC